MKITIGVHASSGAVQIPPGEYWVSLAAEAGEMTLSAKGQDIRIRATKRKTKTNAKTTTTSYYSGGGRQWSLVVTKPKQGEWVAFIDVNGPAKV
jgi:hypothetical protein